MADDQIEMLDRVLTRLALADDSRLESVLDKLLPRLLMMLTSQVQPTVQAKILAILGHVSIANSF
jgi:proteasome component ECM29